MGGGHLDTLIVNKCEGVGHLKKFGGLKLGLKLGLKMNVPVEFVIFQPRDY